MNFMFANFGATLIAALALFPGTPAFSKDKAAAKLPDLVKICKKDCPEAKTNNDAHECAEDKAKGAEGKQFKKSKCWTENERYEKLLGG